MARRPTPTGPIPPHLSVRRYVTSHTSAVRSRVSTLPGCLRSVPPHSLTRGLFFRVPLCGVHCAAASRCRHLHACAAGHASHSAQSDERGKGRESFSGRRGGGGGRGAQWRSGAVTGRRGYPPRLRNGSPRRQAVTLWYPPRTIENESRFPGKAAGRGVRR